jgi:hypothetical protein
MNEDLEKRKKVANSLIEFGKWQSLAFNRGWKLPGNSPLPNESWIEYWKACERYEQDPKKHGRPVIPHRSGNSTSFSTRTQPGGPAIPVSAEAPTTAPGSPERRG